MEVLATVAFWFAILNLIAIVGIGNLIFQNHSKRKTENGK